ncbi:hypothetical protein GOBAR_DD16461 [Gossypium barbadense]|nr:hypothetical protein GOBAR_DD16461 [Gossypium barbadense]
MLTSEFEEASSFQARNHGLDRNQKVSEEHGAADLKASILEVGEGNRSGFEVPKQCRGCSSGSGRGVSSGVLRGY